MVDFGTDIEVFLVEFGEEVLYTPRGGTPRIIRAIVDRFVAMAGGGFGVAKPALGITAANRETSTTTDPDGVGGVGSEEIDAGGDLLTVARRVGETASELTVTELTKMDDEAIEFVVG